MTRQRSKWVCLKQQQAEGVAEVEEAGLGQEEVVIEVTVTCVTVICVAVTIVCNLLKLGYVRVRL
jgi:hypothetical protein